MSKDQFRIFIIDDDRSVRTGFSILLKSAGYNTESFDNAEKFLENEDYNGAGCILLDIFMEGRSGLDLQEEIRNKFVFMPIIYITGQGNIPMSVQALKKGAVNFLQKPVDDKILFEAVEEALAASSAQFTESGEISRLKELISSLTRREAEIYKKIIEGKLNKQIAADLNIAEHTVKLHRGRITAKLGVKSVAEMVRIAEKLNLL